MRNFNSKKNSVLILSNRALKICERKKWSTAENVLNYFSRKGNFLGINNCGLKTNLELMEFCSLLNDHPSLKNNLMHLDLNKANMLLSQRFNQTGSFNQDSLNQQIIVLSTDLLNKEYDPMPLFELYQNIKSHINLSQMKLRKLLRQNESIQFTPFPGEYFGLANKRYLHSALTNCKEISDDLLSTDMLKPFIGQHKQQILDHFTRLGYRNAQVLGQLHDKMEAGLLFWDKDQCLQLN